MTAPIGPGDWVECVDASPYEGDPVPLIVGERYQVLAVWDYLPHRGDPSSDWYDCGIDLVDVPGPTPDLAWGLFRFRPIGSAEPVASLQQPVEELVGA